MEIFLELVAEQVEISVYSFRAAQRGLGPSAIDARRAMKSVMHLNFFGTRSAI